MERSYSGKVRSVLNLSSVVFRALGRRRFIFFTPLCGRFLRCFEMHNPLGKGYLYTVCPEGPPYFHICPGSGIRLMGKFADQCPKGKIDAVIPEGEHPDHIFRTTRTIGIAGIDLIKDSHNLIQIRVIGDPDLINNDDLAVMIGVVVYRTVGKMRVGKDDILIFKGLDIGGDKTDVLHDAVKPVDP